jgi:hypothetical protein
MPAMRFDIDTSDLLRVVRRLDNIDRAIPHAVASALNEAGDATVHRTAHSLALETGLSEHAIRSMIDTRPATPRRLQYEIQIKHGLIEEERVSASLPSRAWEKRDNKDFKSEMLVNIRTMQDTAVCNICDDIADAGPYEPSEIEGLKAMHPHFLNPILNCRCSVIPFRPASKMKVTKHTGQTRMESQMTLRQLSDAIRKNVRTVLRAR